MTDKSNIEFVSKMKPQKLKSLTEDFKSWQSEILADQARWAKYGTNSTKKAALMAGG